MVYRATNTCDSMVGYINEKYKEFGWASAKWDDVMNWIPSRLTGMIMLLGQRLWKPSIEEHGRFCSAMQKNIRALTVAGVKRRLQQYWGYSLEESTITKESFRTVPRWVTPFSPFKLNISFWQIALWVRQSYYFYYFYG